LDWDERNIAHIAKHSVSPEEVEEVFFDDTPHFRRHGKVFYAFGQTMSGRYFVRCVSFCDAEHCSGHYSARHDRKGALILSAGDQKMKQIRKKRLPNMDEWSNEQIAGFWESHDAADFWEEMQPVDLTFSRARKRKRKQIRLTLTEMQWQRLSELANRKGTTPESLVRQWIEKELQAVK
jgi:hypothetical protein